MKKFSQRLLSVVMLLTCTWGGHLLQAQTLFSEDFEGGSMPTGWTQAQVSGTGSWSVTTGDYASSTGAGQGTYNAKITAGNRTEKIKLITPEINLSSVASAELSFMHIQRSWGGDIDELRVYYRASSSDEWALISGCEYTSAVASWTTEDGLTLPNLSATYQIAFEFKSNWGYGVGIDNVIVVQGAACPKPSGLAAALTAGNGSIATLSWTAGGSEDAWVLEYGTASDFTGATSVNVSGGTPSKDLSGLTPETKYYARVKADCGGGDESEWSAICEFTPSDAYSITLNDKNTTNNSYIPIYGTYVDYGFRSQFIIPASALADLQWASIRKLTLYATQTSTAFTNDAFNVYLKEVNSETFASSTFEDWGVMSAVYSGAVAISNNMMEITFATPFTYQGGNLLIGFQQTAYNTTVSCTWVGVAQDGNTALYQTANSSHSWTGTVTSQKFIPKITLDYIPGTAPSCLPPSGLDASEDQPHQSVLSWTANNGETSWDIYYKKVADAEYTKVAGVTTNPYTLPGLKAATNYQFYVVANCSGESESDPSAVKVFVTACEEITSFPWSENFEGFSANIVPLCWDNSATTGTDYSSHPEYYWGVYEYSENKMIRMYNYFANGPLAIINTPTIVLPAEPKELSFEYTHNASSGAFSVKISEDGGANFTELQSYTKGSGSSNSDPGTFTEAAISLADYANKSVILQFYSAANYGSGAIFVDNIRIDNPPTCIKPSGLKKDAVTAHSATLSWTNGAEGQNAWQIAYSTEANFDPSSVTPVDVTTNPATIEGLAQSTTYYAYVRANCGNEDGVSVWSNNKVTFTTPAGNVTPTGLAVEASTITSTQATASWNIVEGNTLHQSYDIYYAEATVTEVPESPAAPNLIAGITETSQVIAGLTAETQYKVWVRDNCGTDGYSAWSSPKTFTTAANCQTPDGLAASNVTNNSASISWNTYGQTGFNLRYSDDGANWTTVEGVNNPYLLDGVLTANTAYQVQVQAACNTEAWSASLDFRTECAAITVASVAYTYGFETADEWVCWTPIAGTSRVSSSSNAHNSTYYLRFAGTTSNLIALPQFEEPTNTLQISFWSRPENYTYSSCGTFSVGYMTDLEDASTFVPVKNYSYNDWTSDAHMQNTVYFANAPTNAYIAFRHIGASNYYWYVDDIEVSLAPSCFPVGTLSYDYVEATSAELSWGLVDDSQTAWVVEYATDENFTDVQTANANNNVFILGNLTPETHYWARVKADCGNGDFGVVSNVINFTTSIACAAPTALTLESSATESLTVSWTENGTATSWTVCYKAEGDADFTCNNSVSVNPYTIEGLTQGTNYTVKVMTNCDNGYLSPAISDVFQTEATCPAPTNLAVTDNSETAYGATITWDGNSENDSYTIEYRTVSTTEFNETYDFDDNTMQGWTTYDEDGDGYSWSVNNGDANSDSYCVRARYNGSAVPYNWLISPQIPLGGTLSFYAKRYSNGSGENFQVYVSTTGTDIADFTAISDVTPGSNSYKLYEYDLSSYSGNGYVAIKHTAASNQWYLYVDDINITANVVTGYGEWQTLTTNASSPYVINTLDPETEYEVRVKGICGSTPSPASNIVGFTTIESCFAPTLNAASNILAHQATLSWTAGASEEAWQICVNGDEDNLINVTENPYVLTGLTAETDYTVKIRSNCGNVDGVSVWSNQIAFTTAEACPMPEGLNVEVGTINANVAWTGSVDVPSYDIKYRTAEGYDFNFFEGFEGGTMPDGWSTDPNDTYDWGVKAGTGSSSYKTAANGSYNAGLHPSTSSYPKTSYLITPAMNLSGVTSATLSFNYINPVWSGGQDELHIYYRVGAGEWQLLQSFTEDQSSWTSSGNIALTGLAANYQIGFFGTNDPDGDYGYGLGIDDVTIIGGELHAAGDWESTTSDEASKQLSGLVPGKKYDVIVKSSCADDVAASWTDPISFTTDINSVTITDALYATHINEYPYVMPEGVIGQAFGSDRQVHQAYASGDVVAAGVPLVLHGDADTYTLLYSADAPNATPSDNLLIGVLDEANKHVADEDNYWFYVLSLDKNSTLGSVGFYWYNDDGSGDFDVPIHKCYLKLPANPLNPAPSYVFNENNTTSLDNLYGVDGALKFYYEGHFYILRDGIIYDATGRKVDNLK